MVSSPTLMTDIKPIVLLEFNFEHREKLKFKVLLGILRPITLQMQRRKTLIFYFITLLQKVCFCFKNSWKKMNSYWLKISNLTYELSMWCLFGGIISVVSEKIEFDYWDESKHLIKRQTFLKNGITIDESETFLFQYTILYICQAFNSNLRRIKEAGICAQIWFCTEKKNQNWRHIFEF